MQLLDSPDFYGHTIFCDDIRYETGGKLTFVGAYTARMIVHEEFPVTLPKFGFGIRYRQRRDAFVGANWIRIQLPGDSDDAPSIVLEAPGREEAKEVAVKEGKSDLPIASLNFQFVVAPLLLAQEGLIKVRIDRGDKWVRLGTLRVQKGKPTQTK